MLYEYRQVTGNQHSTTIVDRLEQVQRAAARFVYADYRRTTSVTHLLNEIGWDSPHIRRLTAQSAMFFKIHHQLVNISLPPSFQPATYLSRHDHLYKYIIPITTIDSYKYSFYPRCIRIWNQLPTTAVTALTPAAFRDSALPTIRMLCPQAGSKLL